MKMAFKTRHILLGIMFCSTLAAAVWVSKGDDTDSNVRPNDSKRHTGTRTRVSAQKEIDREKFPELQLDKMPREIATAEPEQDIFAAKSWYVLPLPPKLAPPPPPQPPSAPPLPFTYMGQLSEESGRLIVYLAKGDRAYTVSQGDVIDNLYRVESATTRQLVLVYLPLSIKQTLSTGTGS